MRCWEGFKFRVNNARYGLTEYGRLIDLGYTTEHFRVAIQFACGCGLASVCMTVNGVRDFFDSSPLWIFIIISVIMEPLVGKALKKSCTTVAGILIGGGLGSAVAATWEAICFNSVHQNGFGTCGKSLTSIAVILGGFGLMLNQQRFPEYADSFQVALILYFTCVYFPELRPLPKGLISYRVQPVSSIYFIFKAKIVLGALIGVGFIVSASLLIFPNTAANRIKRKTEHILERLGNATFRALGEFVQEPDQEGRFPGTTSTDKKQMFRDDGLAEKFGPRQSQLQAIGGDVFQATVLLPFAKAEQRFISSWWRIPRYNVQTYDFTLQCSSNIITSLNALVTSMCDGSMRLGLCVRHRDLMEDVRQDVTATFTALAGLIHGSASEEYVAEKFRNMADALVELYHGVNATSSTVYDSDLETFAIFTKSAINLARQAALIFRELSPMKGKSMHAYIAASFAQTHGPTETSNQPMSRNGSLAKMDRGIAKAAIVGELFHPPDDHRLAAFVQTRVKSFHAEDNPFELYNEDDGGFQPRSWSVGSCAHPSAESLSGGARPDSIPSTAGSGPGQLAGSLKGRDAQPMGSLERVAEEEEEDAQFPQQTWTGSQDEGFPLSASRDRSVESGLSEKLGNEEGWDEATIRRQLLGKLLTRRDTDDTAIRKEQLRASQQAAAVNPFAAISIQPISNSGQSKPHKAPMKRTYAQLNNKKMGSLGLEGPGYDWSKYKSLNSSRTSRISTADSLDVPWDANFVLRRLEIQNEGLYARKGAPESVFSSLPSEAELAMTARALDLKPPAYYASDGETQVSDTPLDTVPEGDERAAESPRIRVDPERRFKKSRTFTEYRQAWGAGDGDESQSDGEGGAADSLPLLRDREPSLEARAVRSKLMPIRTGRQAVGSDANENAGHAANVMLRRAEIDPQESQTAYSLFPQQAHTHPPWEGLSEVQCDITQAPVQSDTSLSDGSLHGNGSLLTTASFSGASLRNPSIKQITEAMAAGNEPAGVPHGLSTAPGIPQIMESRLMSQGSKSRLMEMIRKEGQARNSQDWNPSKRDFDLRAWLQQPHTQTAANKQPPNHPAKQQGDRADQIVQKGRMAEKAEPSVVRKTAERTGKPNAIRGEDFERLPPPIPRGRRSAEARRRREGRRHSPTKWVQHYKKPEDNIPSAWARQREAPQASTDARGGREGSAESATETGSPGSDPGEQSEPTMTAPNFDFVAVKINDWPSEHNSKGRRRHINSGSSSAKSMRGVEEGVEKAQHTMLGAVREFWEARMKQRGK